MQGIRLCLGTSGSYGASDKEQIKIFHKVGFDAFFLNWSRELNIKMLKEYGEGLGMTLQSVHAPFGKAARMWEPREQAQAAIDELLDCLQDCSDNDVPIMVCHAFIGFDKHEPNEHGIKNYGVVVEAAKEYGVKIAFENTEGEEYLAALMDAFQNETCVGFCWDTGHEMCYNRSQDMMALYGDRLIATHLNDNLGIKDYAGEKITFLDDLHLLPFDGIADWEDITNRLNAYGYDGILTFELNKRSKPDRYDNDIYASMLLEQYVTEAYKRACRVAALKLRNMKNKDKM